MLLHAPQRLNTKSRPVSRKGERRRRLAHSGRRGRLPRCSSKCPSPAPPPASDVVALFRPLFISPARAFAARPAPRRARSSLLGWESINVRGRHSLYVLLRVLGEPRATPSHGVWAYDAFDAPFMRVVGKFRGEGARHFTRNRTRERRPCRLSTSEQVHGCGLAEVHRSKSRTPRPLALQSSRVLHTGHLVVLDPRVECRAAPILWVLVCLCPILLAVALAAGRPRSR